MSKHEGGTDQYPDEDDLACEWVTVSPIRLGTLVGPPGAWRFEPVPEGVFVVIRALEGEERKLVGAVAGEDGRLFQLNVRDRTSRTSSIRLYLRGPQEYHVWWTHDQERYARMLEDPVELPSLASTLHVARIVGLNQRSSSLERMVSWFDGDEYHARHRQQHAIHYHILSPRPWHESASDPIFDATPPCIRALCKVEFAQWYIAKAHEKSAPYLATLEHADALVAAAEFGYRDPLLERRAQNHFPLTADRKVFDAFREYAWRCALTDVERRYYESSIQMTSISELPGGGLPGQVADAVEPTSELWYQAALNVREQTNGHPLGPAVHPYLSGVRGNVRAGVRQGIVLNENARQILLEYYQGYLFGVTLRDSKLDKDGFSATDDLRERHAVRRGGRERTLEAVQQWAHMMLAEQAPPETFFVTYSDCFPRDRDYEERYLSAAAYCGYEWWGSLAEREQSSAPLAGDPLHGEWPFWKEFKAKTKLLAETLKGCSKLSKLAGEHLAAYKIGKHEAQAYLDTLGRLQLTLEGHDIDVTQHYARGGPISVEVSATGDGHDVIVAMGQKRTLGGPASVRLKLVTKAERPSGAGAGAKSGYYTRTSAAGSYTVNVPAHVDYLEEMGRFNKPFAQLGEAINVAIAIETIMDGAEGKDRALALFDLVKGTVGVVESFPGTMELVQPSIKASAAFTRVKELIGGTKGLSTVLGRADSAIKIYKAADILFSDSSDIDHELAMGRPFQAHLQRIHDVATVAVGAASAFELGATAVVAIRTGQVACFALRFLAGLSATPYGLAIIVGGQVIAAASKFALDAMQLFTDEQMKIEQALEESVAKEIIGRKFAVQDRMESLLEVLQGS